uniref:Glutathione reductase n=1 Tax=Aureoumbra lagunensis TaxID=44058 RepID=A0A7S3JTG2_9STRA|mmetsp:Transcript_14309/g.19114  ORF Transcript_14309/g.19114 Transcript_14309/m.19114 type:complete len:522 (+) Transcript_14309:470-2035(+)
MVLLVYIMVATAARVMAWTPMMRGVSAARNLNTPSQRKIGMSIRRSTVRASTDEKKVYDYLVIGGGSGGVASARRAATYGASAAVIENARLGGTCVNVGCVPKKIMWSAAHIQEIAHDAALYQFTGGDQMKFDWGKLKIARDNYVTRLNGIYTRNIENSGIDMIQGTASFEGPNSVRVGDEVYQAKNILIAVGGKPVFPPGFEGIEHCITSDGFFELDHLPKSACVVGAGYIAVEMAGIFNTLGCDTTLVVRRAKALRNFDEIVSDHLDFEMKRQGLNIVPNTTPTKVEPHPDDATPLKSVYADDGTKIGDFEVVLLAVGRKPNIEPLHLDAAGVETTEKDYIIVDEYQNTNVPGIYALGDVCGNIELTPMAIAAGRRLADRLFGSLPNAKADYQGVPTVVFSHPPIGTIGLTEAQARAKYSENDIKVYTSTFVNLYYGPMPIEPSTKPKSVMKMICHGPQEKIIGLHVCGMGADEMLQGFGVAFKMGATKADFDSCVAIHPTAAEEFVTLAPWGLSGKQQ